MRKYDQKERAAYASAMNSLAKYLIENGIPINRSGKYPYYLDFLDAYKNHKGKTQRGKLVRCISCQQISLSTGDILDEEVDGDDNRDMCERCYSVMSCGIVTYSITSGTKSKRSHVCTNCFLDQFFLEDYMYTLTSIDSAQLDEEVRKRLSDVIEYATEMITQIKNYSPQDGMDIKDIEEWIIQTEKVMINNEKLFEDVSFMYYEWGWDFEVLDNKGLDKRDFKIISILRKNVRSSVCPDMSPLSSGGLNLDF